MNKNITNNTSNFKPNYLIEKEKKDKEKKIISNNINNLNKEILEKRIDDANENLRKIEDKRLAKLEEMKEIDKKANELNKREKESNVLEKEINNKKNKINEDIKKLDVTEKEIKKKVNKGKRKTNK